MEKYGKSEVGKILAKTVCSKQQVFDFFGLKHSQVAAIYLSYLSQLYLRAFVERIKNSQTGEPHAQVALL